MNIYYSLRFFFLGNKKSIQGTNNRLVYTGALLKNVIISIVGNNNTIVLGEASAFIACNIQIRGDDHLLDIGARGIFNQCAFKFEDHHARINIGNDTTIHKDGEISAVEPFSSVEIGDGCMFASNIDIRNTDSHSILDRNTGVRINPGKNIVIGNRVWAGAYVTILKGVCIGNNSIIGIRSLVNKNIPEHCLAAGIPAKVIRTDVDWCKERI